jgi:hypothetical protein
MLYNLRTTGFQSDKLFKEEAMQLDIGSILSVIIGGSLVLLGQWLTTLRSEKLESIKWQHEESKRQHEAISKFRELRAKPIIEALDRAARRWDWEAHVELMDLAGYKEEHIDVDSDEYKRQVAERRRKYIQQLQDDISAADTIHDDEIRTSIKDVLWRSVDPDYRGKDFPDKLKEAYLKLENWMYQV